MCYKQFEEKKFRGLLGWGSRGSHQIVDVRLFPFISSVSGTTNRPNINKFEAANRPNINTQPGSNLANMSRNYWDWQQIGIHISQHISWLMIVDLIRIHMRTTSPVIRHVGRSRLGDRLLEFKRKAGFPIASVTCILPPHCCTVCRSAIWQRPTNAPTFFGFFSIKLG